MAILSITQLSLDLSLSEDDRVELEQYLLHVVQQYASVLYRQSVKVHICHFAGSWKAVIKVAGAIYLSFNIYGDLRSNLDWLIKDAGLIKGYIRETLRKDGFPDKRILEIKRRECTTDRIRRVFKRIDSYKGLVLDTRFEAELLDDPDVIHMPNAFEDRVHQEKMQDQADTYLERDRILICNMISRIVREELDHEQDRSLFIQSLDSEYRNYIEVTMGVSVQPLGSSPQEGGHFLAGSERPSVFALEPSASFATLDPREDFVAPHPPAILNEISQ
jgi:hypothetical protein